MTYVCPATSKKWTAAVTAWLLRCALTRSGSLSESLTPPWLKDKKGLFGWIGSILITLALLHCLGRSPIIEGRVKRLC